MREINSHVFLVKHQGSTIPRRCETFLQTGPLCSQTLSDCFLEQVFEFMTPASHFSPIITVSDWMASSPRLCLCLLAAHGRTLSFMTLDTFSRQLNVVLTHVCWLQLKPTVCPAWALLL